MRSSAEGLPSELFAVSFCSSAACSVLNGFVCFGLFTLRLFVLFFHIDHLDLLILGYATGAKSIIFSHPYHLSSMCRIRIFFRFFRRAEAAQISLFPFLCTIMKYAAIRAQPINTKTTAVNCEGVRNERKVCPLSSSRRYSIKNLHTPYPIR